MALSGLLGETRQWLRGDDAAGGQTAALRAIDKPPRGLVSTDPTPCLPKRHRPPR